MTRRNFLTAAAGTAFAQTGARPNILFVLADDMGWGDLSCYGNPRMQTPNLDKLARQGIQFTQFYVNGSVCSPTRSAFMTSRFPARNRMHGHLATPELNQQRAMPNYLDPKIPTLPRMLQGAGYRTGHFGKWHLGRGPGAPLPDAYGFDAHESVTSNDTRFEEGRAGFRAESTRWMVDRGLDFIGQDRSQPFYLQLWMLLPHAPLAPTAEQMQPFAKFQPGPHVPWPGAEQIYFASLKDIDDQMGRLFAALESRGLADNTIVVFSSDNGPEDIHIRNASHSAFGTPGPFRGRKRSLYEGGVRVPGIVRWPARIKPRVDDRSVVSAVDLLPTLASITGQGAPARFEGGDVDGEDVSDIWLDRARARRKPLFWEWRFNVAGYSYNRSPMLSMRDGDWKLLMNPDRSRVELYDIPRDRMEVNNRADRETAVVKRMSERVLAWQKTLPEGPADATAGRNDWKWPG